MLFTYFYDFTYIGGINMKNLSIAEIKENNHIYQLTESALKEIEIGKIRMCLYSTELEKQELLSQNWWYHSTDDKLVGLRINNAVLYAKPVKSQQIEESLGYKIYKNSWNDLKSDLIKCAEKFGKHKIRYIGIYALLGDILLLKINGRLCHFNEKNCEFMKWA